MTHQQLADALDQLRAGISASDLHGSLTGYLCGGGQAGADAWTDALELDASAADGQIDPVFALLYRHCRVQLEDSDLGFEPLLPADEVALKRRAEALVEWCRGFLGGIGLAGLGSTRGKLSADASEIVQDFSSIAASSFDYAEDDADETALTEVLEFVRVGVLLLYSELDLAPAPPGLLPSSSRNVH